MPDDCLGLAGVPHPFPYQGSKRALAHAILRCLPEGTAALVEPFAGSAAVSIAARHCNIARRVTISDVNGPLMDLWKRIVNDPVRLSDDYEALWRDSLADPKAWFFAKRDEFNFTKDPAILLYLLNRIVKGSVRYSKSGVFNQSPDNRRLGAKPATVRERLVKVSEALQGATVLSGPYEPLLVTAAPDDVVYMDPPYQGVTGVADSRYVAGLERECFEASLREANSCGVSYIVSYDAVREDSKYGKRLDDALGLTHFHVVAGRSAQSTLVGRSEVTVESLYLSPALADRLNRAAPFTDL